MTSVVVVTKRAGFTLTLHSPDHHFSELRPTTGWLQRTWTEDVVVLDLETAGATAEAVVDLRASGHRQPVVVVANDTDGWDGLFADHPDLHLISLPIAPKSLLSTVDRAFRVGGIRPEPESPPPARVGGRFRHGVAQSCARLVGARAAADPEGTRRPLQ